MKRQELDKMAREKSLSFEREDFIPIAGLYTGSQRNPAITMPYGSRKEMLKATAFATYHVLSTCAITATLLKGLEIIIMQGHQ